MIGRRKYGVSRAIGGMGQDMGVLGSVRATSDSLVSYFLCAVPLGGFA